VRLIRRRFLQIAAAAFTLPATSRIALAQPNYPSRPVRVIVPFPPGGAADIFTRLAAQKLSERLEQQFYVENIGGVGGNIGAGQAAKAAPDGYTVLFGFSSMVVSPSLFAKPLFDPQKDFDPVTLAVATTTALVINPSESAKTVKDLIDVIRGNPGKYSFAHPGLGTQPHLAGEQFRLSLALDLVPVAFTGAGPAIVSVLGGHTPIGFSTLAAAASNVKDGKLRALAVTSKRRAQALPEVPTMAEAGHPDIAGDSWIGVLVPTGTPKDVITLLHRELVQIIEQPAMKERLLTLGYEPVANTPDAFAERIGVEIKTWAKVIRAANLMVH
jgi:tripartite-type tricarboxylate transporter receptor subunit TctC